MKEKMYQALARAQELNASSHDLHLTLAAIKVNELDWASAESEYKKALELGPNSAGAHLGYAGFLSNLERHEEALMHARLSLELDPLSLVKRIHIGRTLYCARRYDEAIKHLQIITREEPDNPLARYFLGASYLFSGKHAEALAEYEAANRIENEKPNQYYTFALARAGRKDAALKILEDFRKRNDFSPAELAIGYIGLGNTEEALALLDRALRERDLQLQFLRVDPHYDEIRQDARFQNILTRTGLAQGTKVEN